MTLINDREQHVGREADLCRSCAAITYIQEKRTFNFRKGTTRRVIVEPFLSAHARMSMLALFGYYCWLGGACTYNVGLHLLP